MAKLRRRPRPWIAAVMIMLVTVPQGGLQFANFFPWSLPAFAMAPTAPIEYSPSHGDCLVELQEVQ